MTGCFTGIGTTAASSTVREYFFSLFFYFVFPLVLIGIVALIAVLIYRHTQRKAPKEERRRFGEKKK